MSKAAELAALIGSQTALSNRNLVFNGAMQVAQRSTSETGVGSSSGYFTLDRWRLTTSAIDGRATMSQAAVTDLPGFANALKLDCTTADTSLAATDVFRIQQRFEGQDLQPLKKGTSSAKAVTISFYMKTNKAFTFVCEFDDTDNSRTNSQQFTTSTSWTRHVLTFAGDTTGTLDDDNVRSAQINIYLHAGSNFTSGTYSANTWQSRASTSVHRAVGVGNFFDNTDNEIQLTGFQMELGEQATPFEHRSYADELARCQRYYERYDGWTTGESMMMLAGRTLTSNRVDLNYKYKVTKRGVPALTIFTDNGSSGTSPNIIIYPSNATRETLSGESVAISGANITSANIRTDEGATFTSNHAANGQMNTDFAFDAEL